MIPLLPTILSFFLWLIQTIPSDVMGKSAPQTAPLLEVLSLDMQKALYDYRAPIGFTFFLIIAIANIRHTVYIPRRRSQAIAYNQLKDAMEECFRNQQAQVRITIFKRASWWETIVHYTIHRQWKDFPHGLPGIGFKRFWKDFPVPFSGEFLIIFSRLGTPGQRVLSTYFSVPDDSEQVEGIVGLAWKDQNPVKRRLPDIRSFGQEIKSARSIDLEPVPKPACTLTE